MHDNLDLLVKCTAKIKLPMVIGLKSGGDEQQIIATALPMSVDAAFVQPIYAHKVL
jgi:hypothetical protein